ncbi:DUF3891 family protein [Candidatus Sumerlaeota bacterium]|nr:DUF3891 family protein [Candidatus Sumerlaeota bacterium]
MIIRTLGGFHYLLPQPEHARQCAMIVSCLKREFLGDGERQAEIVTATRHHDDGWREWEEAPDCEQNGLPINFLSMKSLTHQSIWYRTIFDNLRLRGSAVATLVARHGAELMDHDEDLKANFDGLLTVLRKNAWPEASDEDARFRMERGFSALSFADGLSLVAGTGIDRDWKFRLLRNDAGALDVTARLRKDWTVVVDPWPFCLPSLPNVFIDVALVPVGQEKFTTDFFLKRADHRARVSVHYVPA